MRADLKEHISVSPCEGRPGSGNGLTSHCRHPPTWLSLAFLHLVNFRPLFSQQPVLGFSLLLVWGAQQRSRGATTGSVPDPPDPFPTSWLPRHLGLQFPAVCTSLTVNHPRAPDGPSEGQRPEPADLNAVHGFESRHEVLDLLRVGGATGPLTVLPQAPGLTRSPILPAEAPFPFLLTLSGLCHRFTVHVSEGLSLG